MALPRETIATGAPQTCEDCGVTVELAVHQSSAGFYVGAYCDCGPYSREFVYADTRELAQSWLDSWATMQDLYGR